MKKPVMFAIAATIIGGFAAITYKIINIEQHIEQLYDVEDSNTDDINKIYYILYKMDNSLTSVKKICNHIRHYTSTNDSKNSDEDLKNNIFKGCEDLFKDINTKNDSNEDT